MHSGTRFPCWCSVMKRWISSEVEDRTTDQRQWSHDPEAAKALVLTFALPHRQQAVLVAVAEWPLRHRLKVPRVHPPAGDRVAALAHAGVVAQTPFVQVRVGQRVAAGDPLGLDSETRRHYARKRLLRRNQQHQLTGSKTSMRQSRCTASCVAPSDSM